MVVVLPLAPVMATIEPGQKLRRQFDFANDRLSQISRLHQLRRIDRHTRTHHNQVLPAKSAVAMAASFNRDAMLQQEQNFIAQFGFGLRIRHRNPRPTRLQKKRRSHPGLAQANHQHAFVVKIHRKSIVIQSVIE